MSFYKSGSVSLTNGSTAVVGSGTLFVDIGTLNAGDIFSAPGGVMYEILSIQSNIGLTLATVYTGATASAQPYAIIPIGLLPSALAQQVKTTLTSANTVLTAAVLSTAAQGLTTAQQGNARANILALGAADVGAGRLVKSVAGGVDVALTALEAANQFIELTGVLTASINFIVPTAPRLFVIRNATTGAFAVTVKTAAGTGVTVIQGGRMLIECDGTNCVDAVSTTRQTSGSIDGTPIGATTPAAGSFTTVSATGDTSSTGFHTGSSSASALTSVATTVLTLPSSPTPSLYLIHLSLGGDAFNYSAMGIVALSFTTSRLVSAFNAPLMSISLSGLAVQATQTSGGTQTVGVTYTRLT